jgi:hypothetical protein
MKTTIICTGNSLRGVDLKSINGHITAVNYAFKYVDYDLLMAFDDPVKFGFPVDERLHTNQVYVDRDNLECNGWVRGRNPGIVREGKEIFGKSGSLFCGINVLLKLGFKDIDIYGADMRFVDNYCHFYDEQEVLQGMRKHYWASFEKHKNTKILFEEQLKPDEKLTWIEL